MSKIPTRVTEQQFAQFFDPYLSQAERGFVGQIPRYKLFNYTLYWLHTGCQWDEIPIEQQVGSENKEIGYNAIYAQFSKWSHDGSLKSLWFQSILTIRGDLDLSVLNLDGTQSLAKKGGEKVAYQGRKKGKTSNILPITDRNGYVIACTGILGGNHNDSYELKSHLQTAFRDMKDLGLSIQDAYFNADSSFDTKECRKTCFNHGVIPNIPENRRNRKRAKLGRKPLFNEEIYHQRFTEERTFAWVDKFKRLLIRFEKDEDLFFGAHCIAFTMINLRHLLASEEENVKELEGQ